MINQNEFFRKIHPEQFSDSNIVLAGNLDRNFLDFFLDTLTSKCLEKNFELFCRRIAECEICPNLLPQTGPTGGGDSKVDSETYPVAESISERWYLGIGNNAGTERWAFAISAKKAWKAKVKSDIQKIVEVNELEKRGYSRIFFMSNQYIPDRKRAESEDGLRKEFQIDIRILDRTWLLDKVFSNQKNRNIVIECFSLSDSFRDEIKVGVNDYRRKQEYEALEMQLSNANIKKSELISIAQRSIVLARELEFPKHQIFGLLERFEKLAYEYGSELDVADAIYEAAWTIYWWYPDNGQYYNYYMRYEDAALKSDNVYLFRNLVTLWLNLYVISKSDNYSIETHVKLIQEKYRQFISNTAKPNTALEAKAAYQSMRILLGDETDDIVEELIDIFNDSVGRIDLNLTSLAKIIQEIPLLEKASRYEELFELVVSVMSKQKNDTSTALMLSKRGQSLVNEKPYEALAYFSRALLSFYNEQNKEHLVMVLIEIANIFENVGLLWAARNFYYYDFCLCLNQYMKFGEVLPALIISSYALKYLELRLGRITYSVEFDFLERISDHLYPENIDYSTKNSDNFDYILAIQILRTPYKNMKRLEQLPAYLEDRGLHFSCAAIKYKLGYYDESILRDLNGDKSAFDDLIEKWTSQPALERLRSEPWYGIEYPYVLKSNVLGCTLEVIISKFYGHGEVEVAATLISTIESFFATGIANDLISFTGKIQIDLSFFAECDCLISGKISEESSNHIGILFRDYNSNNIVEEQRIFSDFLLELIGMVTTIMFPFESEMEKIKKMIVNDAALARSQTISNGVIFGLETLGKDTFDFESIVNGYDHLPLLRSEEVLQNINGEEKIFDKAPVTPNHIYYSDPPEEINFKKISHDNIKTSSIINFSLWSKVEWKGVFFITPQEGGFSPIFSLVFTQRNSNMIFEEWIKELGIYDVGDVISIKIIKGIDRFHPFWYRVVIGSSVLPISDKDDLRLINQTAKVHTMMPENCQNLKRFETAVRESEYYYICSSLILPPDSQPAFCERLLIKKNKKSISICNAWEIGNDDILAIIGILPTDEPIIPEGKSDAPIIDIIKYKKKIAKIINSPTISN